MARVPISFYLNILAGVLVLFNHYVASQTGDVALNKVTGAAGRFYSLFGDTAFTVQHAFGSRWGKVVCRTSLDNHLPHDTAVHFKTRYCRTHDSETSTNRQPHGGYGSSGLVSVHHHPPVHPPVPRASTKSPFILSQSPHHRLLQAAWCRPGEVMAMIGTLLIRTCLSCWWFRAPRTMTGILLTASSAVLIVGHTSGESMVVQCVSQVYIVAVVDFLRCIEWEAQHRIVDLGVVAMEHGYGLVAYQRRSQCCRVR